MSDVYEKKIQGYMRPAAFSDLCEEIRTIIIKYAHPTFSVDRLNRCSRKAARVIDVWLDPKFQPPTCQQELAEMLEHGGHNNSGQDKNNQT